MRRWFGRPAILAAIIAAGLIAAVHLFHAFPPLGYAAQRDFLKGEIARLSTETSEIDELWHGIMDFLDRKQIIETIEADRVQAPRLMDELARRRPAGVRLVSVTFSRAQLTVEGVAVSEQALRSFISAVAASPVLQAPERLATKGLEFSFQTALRKEREQ